MKIKVKVEHNPGSKWAAHTSSRKIELTTEEYDDLRLNIRFAMENRKTIEIDLANGNKMIIGPGVVQQSVIEIIPIGDEE